VTARSPVRLVSGGAARSRRFRNGSHKDCEQQLQAVEAVNGVHNAGGAVDEQRLDQSGSPRLQVESVELARRGGSARVGPPYGEAGEPLDLPDKNLYK